MNGGVRVRVPASSGNLGPGFDVLGLALALHNLFEGAPARELSFEATGSEAGALAAGPAEENMVWKAIRAAYAHRGEEAPPFELRAECRIPPSRGLGSSASAVLGGLLIASRFLTPELSAEEVLELATRLEGHPDNVAAALLGGVTAAAQVAGGRVLTGRLRLPRSMRVLAVVPSAQLSTSAARQVLPGSYSRADAVHNLARVAVLAARLARGEVGDLWELLDDRFHQPHRAALVPGLIELLAEARDAGASGGFLSGAGPTMLVLAEQGRQDAVAERLGRVSRRFDAEPRILRLGIEAGGARYTRSRR